MKNYTYRTIIEPDGKYFHGYVPALPGCHTFGRTLEQTKKYIREAIEAYLTSLIENNETIPEEISFESFETIAVSKEKVYA